MRKLFAFLLITIMALALAACGSPAGTGQSAQTPEENSGTQPDDTDLPSTVPDPPAENQYLWLVENGGIVLPYKAFAYGTSYVEPSENNPNGSMLCADGEAFFDGILGHEDEFPAVGKDFEMVVRADCIITQIRVFDRATHEHLNDSLTAAELPGFIESAESDLIIDIVVLHQGKYIEAFDMYENDAYTFGFIVKVEKGALPKLSQMTEEELTETLETLGVEIPEDTTWDLRSLAALFEDDIEAPYPSDVYFDSDHMLFESVREAVKKYYGIS